MTDIKAMLDPRVIHADTVKYVCHPIDIEKRLRDMYPAQFGKDSALTFLTQRDIESLVLAIEEEMILDMCTRMTGEMIDRSGNAYLTRMMNLSDYARVRLLKSLFGKTVYLALSNVHEVKHTNVSENSKDGKSNIIRRW